MPIVIDLKIGTMTFLLLTKGYSVRACVVLTWALIFERRKRMSTGFRSFGKDRANKIEEANEKVNNHSINLDGVVALNKVLIESDLFEIAFQLDRIADILERRNG